MRAVTQIVDGVAVVIDKVISVYVVYVPIFVVIDVGGSIQFHLIDPNVGLQVSMVVVHT
ncbi:hypothetical protein ES703_77701 [subsurface metagenome]